MVTEIFGEWENLKPPTTDQQFIKFVERIELGVANLNAHGFDKEMDSSWSAVKLEKKLSIRHKEDFSRIFTAEEGPTKHRMKSLMKFLISEKKAAYLRTCNYSISQPNKTEDDDSVAANATGVGRDGAIFRGRGGT